MKLFVLVPVAIVMMASAYAETVWVKTPFWQTAYAKAQTAKIKADKNLDRVCDEYSQLVYAGPGKSDLGARDVEILRTNTDQMDRAGYSATFTIDRAASERLFAQSLTDVSAEIKDASEQDILPKYTLPPATIAPLDKVLAPIQIDFAPDSLSRVSQVLGLKPLKIEVAASVPQIKIRVYGLDSVCDLYRAKASLNAVSTGTVKITLDQQLQVSEFYQAFEDLIESAFKRAQTPLKRMAILGYNLAPTLAPLRLTSEKAADLVEALVAAFFNPQGERNENWTEFDGKSHLSVNGAVPVQFQLKLER